MKKIIFDKGLGTYDPPEAFTLSDETLTVKVSNLPVASAFGDYYAVFTNDTGAELTHKLSGNDEIELDNDFIKPGQLHGKVERRVRGKVVMTWEIETLLISQVDTNITASPVIAALKAEIEELVSTFKAQEQVWHGKFKGLSETVESLRSDTQSAITAACSDILKETLKAADENAMTLNEKIIATADLIGKVMKKKRK